MSTGASAQRLPRIYPAYLLVALWLLMTVAEVVSITPLVRSFVPKTVLTLLFLLILAATVVASRGTTARTHPVQHEKWLVPLVAGCTTYWILTFLVRYFARFGYRFGIYSQVLVVTLYGALSAYGWLTRWKTQDRAFFVACCAVMGIVYAVVVIPGFPLDGERSDMLPLVVSANRVFLGGANPYLTWHVVGAHRIPLTYLPALWLTYAPAVVADLDPRWVVIPAIWGLFALHYATLRKQLDTPWRVFLIWMALNPFVFLRHDIQNFPGWFFWTATLFFVGKQKWDMASLFWAILLLSQEIAWLLVPAYLVFLLVNHGKSTTLRACLVTGSLVALTLLLFAAPGPRAFVSSVIGFRHRITLQLPAADWPKVAAWTTGFSLIPALHLFKLTGHAEAMQLAGIIITLAALIRFRPGLQASLQLMALALLWFLLFNALIWGYMYGPLLILQGFACMARLPTAWSCDS